MISRAFDRNSSQGFTLIELIMVIAIAGVVAVMVSTIFGNQMSAFVDLSRRAALVDQAETSVRQIARDVRHALPNSLRVTTSGTLRLLEFIPIIDAGRYRSKVGDGSVVDDDDVLDFSAEDTSFQVLGRLPSIASGSRMVIYNIGQKTASGVPVAGANVYADVAPASVPVTVPVEDSHVISPSGAVFSDAGNNVLSTTIAHQFSFESPQKRFYFINKPVSYICDLANKRIVKYAGYTLDETTPAQPTDMTVAPLLGASIKATLVENVSACSFSYDAGNAQRAGLLTLAVTVEENDESVNLTLQVHVDNAP